ncbi:MAG: hypothetical protein R6W69_00810 [Anaerolineales bacterium]
MKTATRFSVILLTGLLALAALTAVVFYFTQPGATAAAESQPSEMPIQVESDFENDMVSTDADRAEKKWPSATSNDITIQITSVKLTQEEMPITETLEDGSLHEYVYVFDLLEIGMCHTMLDNGDWVIWPDYLHYGNQSVFAWGLYRFEGEAQGEILADGKNTGERCQLLYYPIDDPETLSLPLKFAITSFGVPYNEGYSPCQNIERRWRTNVKAQEYGMKISCQDDFTNGPTVTLDDYSKSVSREDVQWVFDMLTNAEVPGYWEFVITEIEP